MKKKENSSSLKKKINDLIDKQKQLTGLLYSLKIPTVAALTGPAAGAGFSLALACDIRIGNKNSFFTSNYSKIGLSGDYGISWFLANLLGEAKAKEIMMLNKRIYADEALRLGLLNLLFKKEFERNLKNTCEELAAQSSLALKHIKSNIQASKEKKLEKIFIMEAKHLVECANSKEHKVAISKFLKKE
ncbi:enoyl-CoA hydratase-related protein [Alphaproteobacteria bacterium]|nr:enoyl-CoA hydratase-related protein [Alphaproteobacteria bacterium]